ncbi:MAG TPA: hypothetical protein DCR44_06135 [Acholeplasmatales bacterium]|nr:hypothetical protein [Acholeplasmatales bacterium]
MIEIKERFSSYYRMFDSYDVFQNFLKYAIRDLAPRIFVDAVDHPHCVVLQSYPAYFLLGEPEETDASDVFALFHANSWIVASSNAWRQPIEDHFKESVVTHPRVLFRSDALAIDRVLSQRNSLPAGLSIVPIEPKHLADGMIEDDVVSRFFTVSDFMTCGFGFALVDGGGACLGFCLTNYPIVGTEVELYVRVEYDSDAKHRLHGIGTTLCTHFIEESLKRGYVPVWDAANDISAHIAKKLGYEVAKDWFMYHVL